MLARWSHTLSPTMAASEHHVAMETFADMGKGDEPIKGKLEWGLMFVFDTVDSVLDNFEREIMQYILQDSDLCTNPSVVEIMVQDAESSGVLGGGLDRLEPSGGGGGYPRTFPPSTPVQSPPHPSTPLHTNLNIKTHSKERGQGRQHMHRLRTTTSKGRLRTAERRDGAGGRTIRVQRDRGTGAWG